MSLLSQIFKTLVEIRNYLYDRNILRSHKVNAWIISVGNITVGGSGKTPFVDLLAGHFKSKYSVGIVSRGYKAQKTGPCRVDYKLSNASLLFGDEPTLLSQKHPDLPIYISQNRIAGATDLVEKEGVKIIIADDAFQHRKLKRDRDIVLIDATEPQHNFLFLPEGRAREGFDSVKRADIVILTKTNMVSPDKIQWLKNNLRFAKHIFEAAVVLDQFVDFDNKPFTLDKNKSVILVSGIAKPETFEKIMSGYQTESHLRFEDHYKYTQKDLDKLAHFKSAAIVTTEKDAVKLKQFSLPPDKLFIICKIRHQINKDSDRFYELLSPTSI